MPEPKQLGGTNGTGCMIPQKKDHSEYCCLGVAGEFAFGIVI